MADAGTARIDQKRSRDLKHAFKCGYSVLAAYSFGDGLGDQEPFYIRAPGSVLVTSNTVWAESVKNNERIELLGSFCRVGIAGRFERVSVRNIDAK